jgi:hypothetical protein
MVLMPGEGYEGVTKFVMDVMTTYGLNACPPLLVGVGVATSVETAALLSKKALMRPIGSHNENERAAKMETLLEDGINKIGLGPQGMGGKYSVMGVNIENTARHPSTIGVAVNVGCCSHNSVSGWEYTVDRFELFTCALGILFHTTFSDDHSDTCLFYEFVLEFFHTHGSCRTYGNHLKFVIL